MKNAAHQYEDKLLEFAYGELPQHEADAVDAHVRGCARCSQALSELRSVRTAMATLPVETPSDAGLDSLLAYAEQAAKRNAAAAAPAPFWKKYLTPLMAVMTVVTVGVVGLQASKELDSSPAAAAADLTLSARKEPSPFAKEERVQSPSPVVAAAPAPVPTDEAEAADDSRKLNQALGFEGKRAAVQGKLEPTKKSAPQSVTRRSQVANAISPDDVVEQRQQNYSDVGLRGGKQALAEDAKKREALAKDDLAPAAPLQDKGGAAAFGLSGGSLGTSLDTPSPGTGGLSAAPKSVNKPAPPPREEAAPAPAPAPSTSSSGPRGVSKVAEKKKSISLGGFGRGAEAGDSSDEALALEKSDSLGLDRDAKLVERQVAGTRTRKLESARVASNQGDRASEIKYATEVLNSGATGSERAEVLKRLCDAYESLGEVERADPFCDALVREFPNSVAAKTVADRRDRVQRASPAPRAKASEKKTSDTEMEKPAKVEPASAPAY